MYSAFVCTQYVGSEINLTAFELVCHGDSLYVCSLKYLRLVVYWFTLGTCNGHILCQAIIGEMCDNEVEDVEKYVQTKRYPIEHAHVIAIFTVLLS